MSQQTQAGKQSSTQKEESGQQLGPFLCWAVVFADIGTSIYYVPGILYGTVGPLAGFFVFLTMIVFILLTFKYVEVTYRFPEGGGVVTVAAKALNHWFGALGGMFILVDYFLTAAISSLSGIIYLSVVLPVLGPQYSVFGLPVTLLVTILILVLLGILNWFGVNESAKVSMVGAIIAFLSDIAILVTVFTHISLGGFLALLPKMFQGSVALSPTTILVGFAGSFLAFSGLESISQLSPVMRLPRRNVGKLALFLVILTVGLTSPLLTVLSTLLLPAAAKNADKSAQIISLLAGLFGGPWLRTEVAISASALLVFASNTAIIGSYHVFLALSRMEFFPQFILQRNKLRGTPHYSIALATFIPIAVLIIVRGNITVLGDMYAFGLLGAFTLTCLGMDIVRYRARKARKMERAHPQEASRASGNIVSTLGTTASSEHAASADSKTTEEQNPAQRPEPEGRWTRSTFNFILGILTTVLVLLAWSTNLVTKPLATAFGGSVAIIGMGIAITNYRLHRRRGHLPVVATGVEKQFQAQTLAILTSDTQQNEAIIAATIKPGEKKAAVFLYLGTQESDQAPELFRVIEPHLNDKEAIRSFGHANHLAHEAQIPCRFIYRKAGHDTILQVWKLLHPYDTIVSPQLLSSLQEIISDNHYEETTESGPVIHVLKHEAPMGASS